MIFGNSPSEVLQSQVCSFVFTAEVPNHVTCGVLVFRRGKQKTKYPNVSSDPKKLTLSFPNAGGYV